jgi:hypothetical protein
LDRRLGFGHHLLRQSQVEGAHGTVDNGDAGVGRSQGRIVVQRLSKTLQGFLKGFSVRLGGK